VSLTENRLSIRFVVDTHLIDNQSTEMVLLRTLDSEGWIQLLRTDVVDTELSQIADDQKRQRLMSISGQMQEQLGVMVLGHSRLDHCVLGSDNDSEAFNRVWSILSPGRDRRTADRRHVRDAMAVWTAMRYGADAFLTLDGSGKDPGLLHRANDLRDQLGFTMMTPAKALTYVQRRKQRHDARTGARPLEPKSGTKSPTQT
jgi:hypothetical protein